MTVKVTETQIGLAKSYKLTNVEALAAACEKHNFPFFLGCTILAKETGGLNIYGHDKGAVNTISGNLEVTEKNFASFLKQIMPHYPSSVGGKTSNGVGPMQITYKGHFPIMEKLGLKAWIPADNIEYGISLVANDFRNQRNSGKGVSAAFHYAACVYNLGKYSATWPYGVTAVTQSLVWKKRVGTEDFNPPVVVPEVPVEPETPTTPEVPVNPPAVVIFKPERGSKSEWVRVDAFGNLVSTGGFRISSRTRSMYLEACRLFIQAGGGLPPKISQGGLNKGGVAASKGTHDRDAMDTATLSFALKRRRLWELCSWIVGFAAWTRVTIPRVWQAHTHAVPKGGDLSSGAASQVSYFKKGRTGLVGEAIYPRINATGLNDRTWEEYLAGFGVSLSRLEKADPKKPYDDVRDLQWALSRYTGTDLLGDGYFGPVTKAALQKVGPLSEATLTKLGLEVLS